MNYLGWFDDNPKKTDVAKIDEAIARYVQKHGVVPNICLVAESEVVEHPRIKVRSASHVRPNYFYLGVEGTSTPQPLASE